MLTLLSFGFFQTMQANDKDIVVLNLEKKEISHRHKENGSWSRWSTNKGTTKKIKGKDYTVYNL
jgi:hypothetical protein